MKTIISVSSSLVNDFQKALRAVIDGCGFSMTAEAFGLLVHMGLIRNHKNNRDPRFSPWKGENFAGYTYSLIEHAKKFEACPVKDEFQGTLQHIHFTIEELDDGTLIMNTWEGRHRSLFVESAIVEGLPILDYKYFAESDILPIAKKLSGFSVGNTTDPEAIEAYNLFKSCPITFVMSERDPNIATGINSGVVYKLREKVYNLLSMTPFYQFIKNYYESKESGFASPLGTSIGSNTREKGTRRLEIRTYINNMLWVTSALLGLHLDKNGKMENNAAIFMGNTFNDKVCENAAPKMCAIYDKFCAVVNTPAYDFLFQDKGIEEVGRKSRSVHEARTINVARLQAILACVHNLVDERLFKNKEEMTAIFMSDVEMTKDRAAFLVSYADKMLDFMSENGEKLAVTFADTKAHATAENAFRNDGVGHTFTNWSFGKAMAKSFMEGTSN